MSDYKRIAAVAIIHAEGEPSVCRALTDTPAAQEIKRLNAEIGVARYANAREIERKIEAARIKYAPKPKTLVQRIGERYAQLMAMIVLMHDERRKID